MPTGNIAAGSDDGGAISTSGGTSFNASANQAHIIYLTSFIWKGGGWLRFTGITVPQATQITSATIKFYLYLGLGSGMVVKADSRAVPGNPTNWNSLFSPANVLPSYSYHNVASEVDIVSVNTRSAYAERNFDVSTITQTLINSRGYSNGEMVFYLTTFSGNDVGYIYQKDWDIGGNKSPQLIINYIADKTTYRFV